MAIKIYLVRPGITIPAADADIKTDLATYYESKSGIAVADVKYIEVCAENVDKSVPKKLSETPFANRGKVMFDLVEMDGTLVFKNVHLGIATTAAVKQICAAWEYAYAKWNKLGDKKTQVLIWNNVAEARVTGIYRDYHKGAAVEFKGYLKEALMYSDTNVFYRTIKQVVLGEWL